MLALIAGIVVTVGSGFARLIAGRVLMFIAIKALITAIMFIAVPLILNNVITGLMQSAIDSMQALNYSGLDGGMSFAGFTGWLLDCFNVPEVFAILVGALQLRLTIKMIPFNPLR